MVPYSLSREIKTDVTTLTTKITAHPLLRWDTGLTGLHIFWNVRVPHQPTILPQHPSIQMAQMYGSAFIHESIQKYAYYLDWWAHTRCVHIHLHRYTHTRTYTCKAPHPDSSSSASQSSHCFTPGFLPVLRQPLTWVHFIFCDPVGMHGRSLQVTSCTTAEVQQPQALVPAGSQMWLSGGKGRSRAIVSALQVTNLQQPLVQGLLESDMGCMRL